MPLWAPELDNVCESDFEQMDVRGSVYKRGLCGPPNWTTYVKAILNRWMCVDLCTNGGPYGHMRALRAAEMDGHNTQRSRNTLSYPDGQTGHMRALRAAEMDGHNTQRSRNTLSYPDGHNGHPRSTFRGASGSQTETTSSGNPDFSEFLYSCRIIELKEIAIYYCFLTITKGKYDAICVQLSPTGPDEG